MKHLKLSKHIVHRILAYFVEPDCHHLANRIHYEELLVLHELLRVRRHVTQETELLARATHALLEDANQVANEI